jgi:hypothetical protein
MKTKAIFIVFMFSFSVAAFATTNKITQMNVEKLHAQKDYLNMINQCANTKLYNKTLDQALSTKDESKRIVYAAQIEETIINNPSCFIAAVNKLGNKKCEVVEENFIRETYFYPRHEIYRSLSSADDFASSCFAS